MYDAEMKHRGKTGAAKSTLWSCIKLWELVMLVAAETQGKSLTAVLSAIQLRWLISVVGLTRSVIN